MTRRERLESKVEKRREWAESRKATAEKLWEKSDLTEEKSGIPFGQPILVGHHSEKTHRNAIERARKTADKALECDKMAEHHEQVANSIESQLKHTIFSDDDNAVEALEAKISKLEAERDLNTKINKIVRKSKGILSSDAIVSLSEIGVPEAVARKLFEPNPGFGLGIPSYVNQNISGRIKAAKDRLIVVKAQAANREAAQESESGVIIKKNAYGHLFITFAEKPDRIVINALKDAGFRWSGGSWVGSPDRLPECLKEYQS